MGETPLLYEGTYHTGNIISENGTTRKQAAIRRDRRLITCQRVLLLQPALKMLEVVRQEAHLGRRHIDAVSGIARIISKPCPQTVTWLENEKLAGPQQPALQQMEGNCRSGNPAADDGDDWQITRLMIRANGHSHLLPDRSLRELAACRSIAITVTSENILYKFY
jgi:hypothetical protein